MQRRDYSGEELDQRPLSTIRSFPENTVVWRYGREQTLKDYIEERIWINQEETKKGAR